MRRSTPWLLVAAVILGAFAVAFIAGFRPPEDDPSLEARGLKTVIVKDDVGPFVATGDNAVMSETSQMQWTNVTRIWANATVTIQGGQGTGKILLRLRVATPGGETASEPLEVYSCAETGPLPFIESACPPRDDERELVFVDGWRFGWPPGPESVDDPTVSGPPPPNATLVGDWEFEVTKDRTQSADADLITVSISLAVERYRLREEG